MPVALAPAGYRPPTPRNPEDPYWRQALTLLKNAVTDPAQDVMGTNPMAVGGAVIKAAPKMAVSAGSLQEEMWKALKGARTAGDEVLGVVDDAAAPFRANASGESAASLEAMGRRAWEKQTGRRAVQIDRAGKERPFLGEIGDDAINAGEQRGYRYPDGRFERVK